MKSRSNGEESLSRRRPKHVNTELAMRNAESHKVTTRYTFTPKAASTIRPSRAPADFTEPTDSEGCMFHDTMSKQSFEADSEILKFKTRETPKTPTESTGEESVRAES